MKQLILRLAPVLVLAAASASAGSFSFISSLSSLSSNDQVNWSQVGSPGSNAASPVNASSVNGLNVTASNGDAFTVYQQEANWSGNFANGDILLGQSLSDIGGRNDPLTLSFTSGVLGAGLQVQSDYFGAFTMQLQAYDTSNTLLGTQSFGGNSTSDNNGSAIFIGALDSTPDIGRLVLTLTNENGGGGFAVDTLFLNDSSPVPEPASYALLLSGLAGLAFYRRRKA